VCAQNAEFSSKAAKKLSEKYRFMEEAMAQQESKREMADAEVTQHTHARTRAQT
jgi:hypothetical protein